MESNYSITHYQTSFWVSLCSEGRVDTEIKFKIWDWIKRKEIATHLRESRRWKTDYRYRFFVDCPFTPKKMDTGRDLFKSGLLKRTTIGIKKSVLQTARCFQDEQELWGMRYEENKIDSTTVTEIGITYRKEEKRALFNIRVIYRPKTLWDTYKPSIPNVVKWLFTSERPLFSISSGDGTYTFSQFPIAVQSAEDGQRFLKYLLSDARKSTLVLAIPTTTTEYTSKALSVLTENLMGKSLVFTVEVSSDAHNVIMQTLKGQKTNIRPYSGGLFLFHPHCSDEGRLVGEEYPLDQLKSDGKSEIEGRKVDLKMALLGHLYRQHPVLEEGAVLFADVQWAIEESIAQKERALEEAREKEREAQEKERQARDRYERAKIMNEAEEVKEQAKRGMEESEKKREEQQRELKRLEDELTEEKTNLEKEKQLTEAFLSDFEKMEHDKKDLQRKVTDLQDRLRRVEARASRNEEDERIVRLRGKIEAITQIYEAKRNLSEGIKAVQDLFEDRLIITDKAIKSLDNAPKQFEFSDALAFLLVLYAVLYPSYKTENLGVRRDCYVQEHPLVQEYNLTYTANETPSTMSNAEYREARTVRYKGAKYVCEAHLKMSRDYRVYFAYNKDFDKIIICHIGGHLNTAGTKKKGLS